ncbi:MAG: TIGR03016 family PEP-CTERM system-associated outer membrane protein, partial [Gammaproteobacteria bacterium]|nr:TIGR03016 family PEP-CTERM system-associated outer membrane protein [Gammaproteobacteria bacterium]
DGSDEESDLIPTIAPHWSIKGEGARVNFEMVGSSKLKDVGGGNQANSLRYQTHADAELLERILFIDADATAAQNAIDPLSASGADSLSESDNTTTTYSLKVSPYVIGRIKSYANFQARYTYSYVTSDEIDNGDTRSSDFNVSLSSGPKFGDLIWGVTASDRTTNSQSGSSTDKSSIALNLGYQLNRRWRVTGLIGDESTDYTSNGDTGGINWELGAVWTPSIRTSVDVGYGRRFSGPTGHLNLSHRSKRSLFTASYSQAVTDNNEQFSIFDPYGYLSAIYSWEAEAIGNNPLPDADAFPNDEEYAVAYNSWVENAVAENALPSESDFLTNIDNNAQFLSDRFAFGYVLQGKRTTLAVNGNYTKNTAGDASETTGVGLGATLKRDLSGLLSANASLSWNRTEEDDSSQSDRWNLRFGLKQKLGKKTSLSLDVAHTKRESDNAGDSYDENRVTLSISHAFYQ